MIINHNMSSLYARRIEGINSTNLRNDIEKLSSGQRINSAKDDASGLAVSEKMRSQIRGLNQASKNVGNGVSLLQTTEGYLSEVTDVLQRIRELAVQGANGVYSDEDRSLINVEVNQLVSEIDRISSVAQFNGMSLLTGRFAENGMQFQIGANMDQRVEVKIDAVNASVLGLRGSQDGDAAISVESQDTSNIAIGTIDEALKTVNSQRANIGAYQNRFETAKKGIDIASENLTASESRIRDVDMAEAITEYARDSILNQASVAMLAQANANSANVLALLRS